MENNNYKKPTTIPGEVETQGLAVPVFTFPMVAVAYAAVLGGVIVIGVNGAAGVNVMGVVNVYQAANVSVS